jgi:hypothetical protein
VLRASSRAAGRSGGRSGRGALARAARLGGALRPRPRRNGQGAQRGQGSAARATTTLTRDYAAVMERAKLQADFDHFT